MVSGRAGVESMQSYLSVYVASQRCVGSQEDSRECGLDEREVGWGTRYRNEKGPGPRKPSTLDSKLNLPPGFLQTEVALVQLYFPGLLALGWHPHFRLRLCVPAWRRQCGALYAPYGALFAFSECSAVHSVSLMNHMPVKRRYIYLSPGSWVPAVVGLACPRTAPRRLFQFFLWSGPSGPTIICSLAESASF